MPIWIQTVDAAAAAGWSDHTVMPEFTRCCTHAGDPVADGWMTSVGRPSGMPDWSCRSPSNSHSRPKAMRRNRRAAGSGGGVGPGAPYRSPRATARRYCMDRSWFHPTKRTTARARISAPWTASAWWNSAMMDWSPGPGGPPIPVIGGRQAQSSASRYRPGSAAR